MTLTVGDIAMATTAKTRKALDAWDACENSVDVERARGRIAAEAADDFEKLYRAPLVREGDRLSDGTCAVEIQVPGGKIRVCLAVSADGLVTIASQSACPT